MKDLDGGVQPYHQMLNAVYDGMFVADADGVCRYVNDAFVALAGTSRDGLIGKTVTRMIEEGIVSNSATAAVLKTRAPASTVNIYANGKTCLVTGTPVFVDGVLTRVICVVRDLTELNQLRDKLNEASSLTVGYRQQLKEIKVAQDHTAVVTTRSKAMNTVFAMAIKVAAVEVPVLLLGETGVGKDFLAQFIHDVSERSKTGALVKVNCGAIPETLLESELFGYERGAFTGADQHGKAGLFELARHGTLFLDEIGEIPRALQVKLLNVLQDRRFYRLGGTKAIELQARLIAATNADIEKLIADGLFRRDLYHRLNVVSCRIPSLRERYDDILPLAMSFLADNNQRYRRECHLSPKTMELFLGYDWPGNIRELKNTVERLVIMSQDSCIQPQDFEDCIDPDHYRRPPSQGNAGANGATGLKTRVEEFERDCIKEALANTPTLRKAAELLGIDISTLVRKKQRLALTSVARIQA
jgi:PAS domain S-box-containing protein